MPTSPKADSRGPKDGSHADFVCYVLAIRDYEFDPLSAILKDETKSAELGREINFVFRLPQNRHSLSSHYNNYWGPEKRNFLEVYVNEKNVKMIRLTQRARERYGPT